jgi:hypothetical protein
MQNELGEAAEAAARSNGSLLPQERHPAAVALAAANFAPQLIATILAAAMREHERAAALQLEWSTFPALILVTSGALAAVARSGTRHRGRFRPRIWRVQGAHRRSVGQRLPSGICPIGLRSNTRPPDYLRGVRYRFRLR